MLDEVGNKESDNYTNFDDEEDARASPTSRVPGMPHSRRHAEGYALHP
jgi:hypothetical protein